MTSFDLTEHALLALRAGAWLGGGALIGAFYFLTLRWNVRMLAFGRAPLLAMALQLGAIRAPRRRACASSPVDFGALPLLLATAGILAARTATVRLAGADMIESPLVTEDAVHARPGSDHRAGRRDLGPHGWSLTLGGLLPRARLRSPRRGIKPCSS